MTVYYTQDQVDEIGAFIAEQITESNESLKKNLEEKINNLKPVEPSTGSSDTGGTSASGSMFLDDGREIKQKLIETTFNSEGMQYHPHGLLPESILSVQATAVVDGNVYCEKDQMNSNYSFTTSVQGAAIELYLSGNSPQYLPNKPIRFLITYAPDMKPYPQPPEEEETPPVHAEA